jgi:hypothetical protein
VDALSQTLHKHSYGITALAAALYMLAQGRAITTGIEKLTTNIIESVSQDSLGLIQELTERHRLRGKHTIFRVASSLQTGSSASSGTPPENSQANNDSNTQHISKSEKSSAETRHNKASTVPTKKQSKSRKPSQQINEKDDVRTLGETISAGISAYEAFKNAGHIRSSTEFLKGDVMQ